MPEDIIEINELVERLEIEEYIDCSSMTSYADENEYESIMWYLKNIQTIINDIRETNTEYPLDKNKFEKIKKSMRKKVK